MYKISENLISLCASDYESQLFNVPKIVVGKQIYTADFDFASHLQILKTLIWAIKN